MDKSEGVKSVNIVPRMSLGEMLVRADFITPGQLSDALEIQQKQGLITPEELATIRSAQSR